MNTKDTDQNNSARPTNEADKLLEMLYARDVLSVILKREECKLIIVKLGITIPIGKPKCLLCGRDGQNAIYLFSCIRDPNRNNGQLGITGFRFDIQQYLRRPIKNIPEVSAAFRYCAFGVAQLEGLDLRKSTFTVEGSFLN